LEKDLLESLLSELRRGTLILCVLSLLDRSYYGYALVQDMSQKGEPVDANTLTPLLRRLEMQKLLYSGDQIYASLAQQWREMSAGINSLIGGNEYE